LKIIHRDVRKAACCFANVISFAANTTRFLFTSMIGYISLPNEFKLRLHALAFPVAILNGNQELNNIICSCSFALINLHWPVCKAVLPVVAWD